MKIDFEGRTWSYDDEDITVQDAEIIEKETGGSVADWASSRAGVGSRTYRILYWLMRSQNGDPVPLAEVNFRLLPFVEAFTAAIRAEAAAAEAAQGEPDPTVPPLMQGAGSQSPAPPPSETATASQPG